MRTAQQAGVGLHHPSALSVVEGQADEAYVSLSRRALERLAEAVPQLGAEHGFPGFWRVVCTYAGELARPVRMAVLGSLPGSSYEVIARTDAEGASLGGFGPWAPSDVRLRDAFAAPGPTWIDDLVEPAARPHAFDRWMGPTFPRSLLVVPAPSLQDRRVAWILEMPTTAPEDRPRVSVLLSMYALHVGTLAQLLETRLGRATHERELKQIHALTEALGLADGLEDIERVAVHYAKVALGGERAWFRICPAGSSLIGRVVRDRRPVCITDTRTCPPEDALTLDPALRSLIAVPVRVDDAVLGALSVGHDEAGAFDPEQFELLGRIAHAVASAYTRKVDELALREAKRAAEAASSAKTEFLANMSYAIRTPLSGVVGMADLLATSTLTEDQRECVDTIRQSSDALLTIIEDVLDFSSVEAARVGLEPVTFSVADTVGEVVNLFLEAARAKAVELEYDVPSDESLQVVGDPVAVRQVVANLVSNALKFTDCGKVTVSLGWAHGLAKRTRVEVRVRDTGGGIPTEHLDAMFESGGTSMSSGGVAGSRRLAETMGGTIEVRSEVGRGSTYTLRVPFERAVAPSCAATSEAPEAERGGALSQLRVLLVDDNVANIRVASRMLAKLGCEVSIACSGSEAIERVCAERFDLILMDCQMPGMDGWEATRCIRAGESPGERVPILAMTADVLSESRDQCFAAGMDGFIAKPIVLRDLQAHLEAWAPARRRIKPVAA